MYGGFNPDPSAIAAGALLGVASLLAATAFRLGWYRRPARQYWDSDVPWFVRNLAFAFVPIGLFFAVGLSFLWTMNIPEGAVTATGLATIVLFVQPLVAVLWMRQPPEFLKPTWLKEAETVRKPPRVVSSSAVDRTFLGCIVVGSLGIIVMAAIAILVAAFGGPVN
jgi:hypothetical protein